MLGTPTDVYIMGAMMFWMPLALAIGSLIAAYVYLPLLQDLGILSISQVCNIYYSHITRLFNPFYFIIFANSYRARSTLNCATTVPSEGYSPESVFLGL